MTNQYLILSGEAPPDLFDDAAGDQDSKVILYAGGSDSGVYPKAPPDFEPSLHMMLMSTYWRHIEACPEQASPMPIANLTHPRLTTAPNHGLTTASSMCTHPVRANHSDSHPAAANSIAPSYESQRP